MTISVLKTLFRKLLPKIINYKGFKKMKMKGSLIHYNTLSVKKMLITAKTQINFMKFVIVFLIITHPGERYSWK